MEELCNWINLFFYALNLEIEVLRKVSNILVLEVLNSFEEKKSKLNILYYLKYFF